MLSAHTDVVPVDGQDWTTEPFALTERDDLLIGRGVVDMKGFLAACIAAAGDWAGTTPAWYVVVTCAVSTALVALLYTGRPITSTTETA